MSSSYGWFLNYLHLLFVICHWACKEAKLHLNIFFDIFAAYANIGDVETCNIIVTEMETRKLRLSRESYNTLLKAHARCRDANGAIVVLRTMQRKGEHHPSSSDSFKVTWRRIVIGIVECLCIPIPHVTGCFILVLSVIRRVVLLIHRGNAGFGRCETLYYIVQYSDGRLYTRSWHASCNRSC